MQDIPYGYCQCGCGQKTSIATRSRPGRGWIKGEPTPFLRGHSVRSRAALPFDRGTEDECWIWRGAISSTGYGSLGRGGRIHNAHRYVYERERGPIPDGMQLDHLCRNRACVNPAHLEPVTCAENVRRSRTAKLTPATVFLVRLMWATTTLSQVKIADTVGLVPSSVSRLLSGQRWT